MELSIPGETPLVMAAALVQQYPQYWRRKAQSLLYRIRIN